MNVCDGDHSKTGAAYAILPLLLATNVSIVSEY